MMPDECASTLHSLLTIVGSTDLRNSMQKLSLRFVSQLRTVKYILVLHITQGKKNCKKDIKMKNNTVQNNNRTLAVYYSSRSFVHIFPAIMKTVHSTKSNSNRNS